MIHHQKAVLISAVIFGRVAGQSDGNDRYSSSEEEPLDIHRTLNRTMAKERRGRGRTSDFDFSRSDFAAFAGWGGRTNEAEGSLTLNFTFPQKSQRFHTDFTTADRKKIANYDNPHPVPTIISSEP